MSLVLSSHTGFQFFFRREIMQQNNCTPFSLSTTHASSMRCEAQMLSFPPFLGESRSQTEADSYRFGCGSPLFSVIVAVLCLIGLLHGSTRSADDASRPSSAGAYSFDGKGDLEVMTNEKASSLLDEFVGQADFAPTHLRVCQGRHFVVAEVVNC